jgi:hypothetical protein
MPEPATVDDLRVLSNLSHDEQGWWEHWTDEDGDGHRQLLGDDAAALRWLDFWRSVQ